MKPSIASRAVHLIQTEGTKDLFAVFPVKVVFSLNARLSEKIEPSKLMKKRKLLSEEDSLSTKLQRKTILVPVQEQALSPGIKSIKMVKAREVKMSNG